MPTPTCAICSDTTEAYIEKFNPSIKITIEWIKGKPRNRSYTKRIAEFLYDEYGINVLAVTGECTIYLNEDDIVVFK